MARHTIDLGVDFREIRRIRHIDNRMPFRWVPPAELNRQNHYLIVLEVILGQFHFAVEDCPHVFRFQLLRRRRIRAVALETQVIHLRCSQQMLIIPAVWLMANGARLLEYWLM